MPSPPLFVDQDTFHTPSVQLGNPPRQKTFFFARVDAEDTEFDPNTMAVEDFRVYEYHFKHEENKFPSLDLMIQNPLTGLIGSGQKRWGWLSWYNGYTVEPLMFGRIIGVPTDMSGEMITVTFISRPVDYERQRRAIAVLLRQPPYYDPIFVDEAHRNDPNAILEAYTRVWHINRLTLEVTTTDVISGEDGTEEFGTAESYYDGLNYTVNTLIPSVKVDATIDWKQTHESSIDMGRHVFVSYSGDSIIGNWPKVDGELGKGYKVAAGTEAIDSLHVADTIVATWSASYQNKAKEHMDGDTMSINISGTAPLFEDYLYYVLTHKGENVIGDPFTGQAAKASVSITNIYVPKWVVETKLFLTYSADRGRKERVVFVLHPDIQDLATVPEDFDRSIDTVNINGADVAISTSFSATLTSNGTNVSDGDQIVIGAYTYTFQTTLTEALGHVHIGADAEASLLNLVNAININGEGTTGVDFAEANEANTEVIAEGPTTDGYTFSIIVRSIDTESRQATVSTAAVTLDWDSDTLMPTGEIPIEDPALPGYFTTDRGKQSIEYLLMYARAKLAFSARAVNIRVPIRFERAIQLSGRMNARIFDRRFPGGQVVGKIVNYGWDINGDSGEVIGWVEIGCTIGNGNSVSPALGTPTYVEEGYFGPGEVQQYSGATLVPASGDIGWSFSTNVLDDDGLSFPLSKEQIVVTEAVHGSLETQKNEIVKAFRSEASIAALSAVQAGSAQASVNIQKLLALLNETNVKAALENNPIWYELELKPLTNTNFSTQYNLLVGSLKLPKGIDLEGM